MGNEVNLKELCLLDGFDASWFSTGVMVFWLDSRGSHVVVECYALIDVISK